MTRYGPSVLPTHGKLTTRRSRDPHAGDWLLFPVSYSIPTKDPKIGRRIYPAYNKIERELRKVLVRRGSTPQKRLNKELYRLSILLGPTPGSANHEYYKDAQAWLSSKLRSGARPSYS